MPVDRPPRAFSSIVPGSLAPRLVMGRTEGGAMAGAGAKAIIILATKVSKCPRFSTLSRT